MDPQHPNESSYVWRLPHVTIPSLNLMFIVDGISNGFLYDVGHTRYPLCNIARYYEWELACDA
jgi:hypothetical protein